MIRPNARREIQSLALGVRKLAKQEWINRRRIEWETSISKSDASAVIEAELERANAIPETVAILLEILDALYPHADATWDRVSSTITVGGWESQLVWYPRTRTIEAEED